MVATLRDAIQRGTTAAKPAATAVDVGTLYFDTDLDKMQRSNGTSWDDVERADPAGAATGAIQTADVPNSEAEIQYDTATERVLVYDGQRARAVGSTGWAHLAMPVLFSPTAAFTTSQAMAANGGSVAVPMLVPSHMLLQRCVVKNRDTSGARSWEWRLYQQYLNNGNSSENTLAAVTGADGSESFTAAAVSTRVSDASGAPVYLAPGIYWLVIRNTHASNGFSLANNATSAEFTPVGYQTKTLGSSLGATLDFVAATWSLTANMVNVRLDGRVFGMTASL